MKKVVYFLGAGFSVPAGLPVISNFLFKARDQHYNNPNKHQSFIKVFEYIDSLSKVKNFTEVDLYNIEEVFSIADMHDLLGNQVKKDLEQFIKDVIVFHTPEFKKNTGGINRSSSIKLLFGDRHDEQAKIYIGFVASLLAIVFKENQSDGLDVLDYTDIDAIKDETIQCEYQIITLNYDTLIEQSVSFLNEYFSSDFSLPIAKLHGSVNGEIIPPSWSKSIKAQSSLGWKEAARWLSEANEIRILGYSLPQSDTYIKHLFSTALSESKNLQKIDVMCLDSDNSVRERYKKMFSFPRFNFYNIDLRKYLSSFSNYGHQHRPFETHPTAAEEAHRLFIDNL